MCLFVFHFPFPKVRPRRKQNQPPPPPYAQNFPTAIVRGEMSALTTPLRCSSSFSPFSFSLIILYVFQNWGYLCLPFNPLYALVRVAFIAFYFFISLASPCFTPFQELTLPPCSFWVKYKKSFSNLCFVQFQSSRAQSRSVPSIYTSSDSPERAFSRFLTSYCIPVYFFTSVLLLFFLLHFRTK